MQINYLNKFGWPPDHGQLSELDTGQFFSFVTTTQQGKKPSGKIKSKKNVTASRSQNGEVKPNILWTYCKNQPFFGLKTWSRCRRCVVACPALKNVLYKKVYRRWN